MKYSLFPVLKVVGLNGLRYNVRMALKSGFHIILSYPFIILPVATVYPIVSQVSHYN